MYLQTLNTDSLIHWIDWETRLTQHFDDGPLDITD